MSEPMCFSTRTKRPSDRVKAWSRYLSETYFGLGVRTKDDDVIGEIVARSYGSTSLSSVVVSSSRATRSRQSASFDKVERFCFVFPTHGTFEHRQRGVENRSGVGSVFVLNSAEPYEVDNDGAGANVCLTVPCDRIRPRVREIDDFCSRSDVADPTIASTLRHLVQATLTEGLRSDEAPFEDLCLDMLTLMLSRPRLQDLPANYAIGRSGLLA